MTPALWWMIVRPAEVLRWHGLATLYKRAKIGIFDVVVPAFIEVPDSQQWQDVPTGAADAAVSNLTEIGHEFVKLELPWADRAAVKEWLKEIRLGRYHPSEDFKASLSAAFGLFCLCLPLAEGGENSEARSVAFSLPEPFAKVVDAHVTGRAMDEARLGLAALDSKPREFSRAWLDHQVKVT